MSKLTKQQRGDEAWETYTAIRVSALKAYRAIVDPAYRAYEAKLVEIYGQAEELIESEEL